MLGDRHTSKALMIDHENASFSRCRNIDVVGAESGGGHDDEVLARLQHVGRHALRGPHPKGSCTMQDLLDLGDIGAVDNDNVSAAVG